MITPSSPGESPIARVSVGAVVRRRRRALGLSQEDLASALGAPTTVADIKLIESERILMPSWIRLMRLSSVLELPVDALIGLTNPGGPRPVPAPHSLEDALDSSSRSEMTDEPLSQ
jgi:transcriptional regulator with XRE-family HTH domain